MLIPLPSKDFDPTEAAVPWRVLVADAFAAGRPVGAICRGVLLAARSPTHPAG